MADKTDSSTSAELERLIREQSRDNKGKLRSAAVTPEKRAFQKQKYDREREPFRNRKGKRTGLPKTATGLVIPPPESLDKIKHGANWLSQGTRPATLGEIAMLNELPAALTYLINSCQPIKVKPTGEERFRIWDADGVHVHEYSAEALDRVRRVYNALNWVRSGTEIEDFWAWNTHQAFYKALSVASSDKGARGGICLEIPTVTSAHTAVQWVRRSSPFTPDSLTRERFQAALDRATLKPRGGGRGTGRKNWDTVANELIAEAKESMTCMLSPKGERVPEAFWKLPPDD